MTSHDVVARLRRLLGTRRIGHAGTLDPMATGVLVCGVQRATKLLGHLPLEPKVYRGTVRLGMSTTTDDAEGACTGGADASAVSEPQIRAALATLCGTIEQVPSTVSAVKIDGRRAYALARAGAQVLLPARPVTVSRFELLALRPGLSASLDEVVAQTFPHRSVDARQAGVLAHGGSLPAVGLAGTHAAIDPDGVAVALLAEHGGRARPILVLCPAGE
jgi:tRNA pseudouridine55 synthase